MTRRERNQSRKGTKRALTSSVLAIALCVVLLAGATFAWFTDTASTKVSKIEAGKLKIELQYYKSETDGWVNAEGQTLSFTNASGETDILWEPGATFVLPKLKVVNKGDLALKYKVVVSSIEGDDGLANALNVTLTDGEKTPQELGTLKALSEMDVANISENHLSTVDGKTETEELTLAVQMDKAAGNEYQGKSISGVTVTVFATQDTVEYDSENNQYDNDATYAESVATVDDLKTALANNTTGAISLAGDITLTGTNSDFSAFSTSESLVIDSNGQTMTNNAAADGDYNVMFYIKDTAKVTFTGDGTFANTSASDGKALIYASGASTVTVKSGTFTTSSEGTAVWAHANATVYIEDGVFINDGKDADLIYATGNAKIYISGGYFEGKNLTGLTNPSTAGKLLNVSTKWSEADKPPQIIVSGGTFVNFDPSGVGVEGETYQDTDYIHVASGYEVVSETQANGDIWYTVVPQSTT